MAKLFKKQILGLETTDSAENVFNGGLNSNIRLKFSYLNNEIGVTIEKIIRAGLIREQTAETITYETVAEKTYVPSDFSFATDMSSYIIEYNVLTNEFFVLDFFDWAKENVIVQDQSEFINESRRLILKRYNENYIRLFSLYSTDSNVQNWDSTRITLYYFNQDENSEINTIISSEVSVEEANDTEITEWSNQNQKVNISYSIFNEDGTEVQDQITTRFENRYRVSLSSGKYKVRINFQKPAFSTAINTYSISVVNGVCNKNRIVIASGTNDVILDLNGLSSGDYSKFKLNLGKFISYSQLWVDIK